MNSTNKGLCLLLSPKGKKNPGKISIDTKAFVPPTKTSQPQSTKNSTKPSGNSIPTYRLMQYQRQANTLRNAAGAKKSTTRGRPNATTTAAANNVNKSKVGSKKVTETSIRENSIEDSKDKAKLNSKKQEHNICLINSSITAQPISVNISIRNHMVGVVPASTTNASTQSKKITSYKVVKPAPKALMNTTSVKNMGPVLGSPKASPKRKEEKKAIPAAPKVNTKPVKPATQGQKTNISLTHLQQLLKSKTATKEIPIKEISAETSRIKKSDPKKVLGNTIPATKKVQTTSHPALLNSLNVSRNNPKNSKQDTIGGLFPLTASQALKLFAGDLSDIEKGEILDYDTIYFMGNGVARLNADTSGSYDDDKGDYNTYVGEHVGYRYEIIDILGKGSFGQAIKCLDHKDRKMVALKIIRSKKRFYHQATVEVKILKYIKDNDPEGKSNVVKMLDYFIFRKHICIAFELLNINLYDYIKENNFVGFNLDLIRKFAVQILQSLKMLKEHSIIHCDLKPENILLEAPNSSTIKLIDFGSSCFDDEKIYTYIQSRFYRAPEIMLGIAYTTAIDMWSLGCILAELFTGFPIFPGESEPEQMVLIMEVNGLPPADLLKKASRRDVFFNPDNVPLPLSNHKEATRKPGSKTLGQILKCVDTSFVDFLQQCFIWEPEKRITPDQALNHKWITKGSLRRGTVGNTSGSTLGSIEMSLTQPPAQIQTYYATQRKPEVKKQPGKKDKPGLNKTLVHNNTAVGNTKLAIGRCEIIQRRNEEGKLEDKLAKLKEKLKAVTTKHTGVKGHTKYNTNPVKKTGNNSSHNGLLLHVISKKPVAPVANTKPKQQLKQSNIF